MSELSAKIFAAQDIETQIITVRQWGVDVEVRSMSARDRSRLLASAVENDGRVNFEQVLPDVVILCTYDPTTGERVFGENDRDALLAKSATAIEQIATTALGLSGMSEDAVDEAGKDLSPTLTEDSSLN